MKKILVFAFAAVFILFATLRIIPKRDAVRDGACVPIFMYHNIGEDGDPLTTVNPETFELHMKAISQAGFQTVSFERLIEYVDEAADLPERPICIVFDDGYLSNYEYAYPILKKYGMCASVAVIGSSVGASQHRKTGVPIIPHFSWEQAAEMYTSGVVCFVSHTYDMHMVSQLESKNVRQYCARLPYESADSFIRALNRDHLLMSKAMNSGIGTFTPVFAYPHGVWDSLSESILRSLGYRVTLICDGGINTVRRGDPDSLFLMRRINITQETEIDVLIESVSRYTE